MKTCFKELHFETPGNKAMYFNIKQDVVDFVAESGVKDGIIVVQSPHTTCSVIFEEMVHDFDFNGDEYLQVDLNKALEKIFPRETSENDYYKYPGPKHMAFAFEGGDEYFKNNPGVLLNGPAHLKGSLLGASESFVIKDHKILTGDWGYIYFVDWDFNRPRKRKCYLMIVGE